MSRPIRYYEVYEKFSDLDGTNKAYKGRFKFGFGDALDLAMRDKVLGTMTKVWGGMNFEPQPGVPVERGNLSELALRGQNLLKDILGKDRGTLYDLAMRGEVPDDALIKRLLLNGFKYWDSASINKPVRQRFYEMARERQAESLTNAMERAAPRARKQFQRMLDELKTSKTSKGKDGGLIEKLLSTVGELVVDTGLEMLNNAGGSNFILPVIGPPPTPSPLSLETSIFKWLIKGYKQRRLTPPTYDDLKAGEPQLRSILKTMKGWLEADVKSSGRNVEEVANPSGSKLATNTVDVAEQIQMVQAYTFWAERVDPGRNPWLWEGPEVMYSFVGSYSYRSKRPLSRLVVCSVVSEALETILASITNVELGGIG
ncbi:hypothetical protein F53441_7950 [Fusarium austroafricanum]|uniref:Uncharacterized protein n=1 Tax=Fusarium austroafricanum TaxID=2364996 RepID=A0A8H4NXW9_9HYPO|nr:hypothetical protein F53441_7950 [Fusarium austroafricanum]